MALILDGTNGLSDVDGSAATPAIRGSDANTGVFFGTDIVGVSTGGSERVRVDASGNVGIGTSSPGSKLQVSQTNTSVGALFNGTTRGIRFGFDATGSIIEGVDNTGVSSFQPLTVGGLDVRFTTSGSERARIDSSGNLAIGSTSAGYDGTNTGIWCRGGLKVLQASRDSNPSCNFARIGTDGSVVTFSKGVPDVGSISVTASATAYNTSSDYRLKHDIQPMTGALAKVAALKPVTYKWNIDDSESQGFIAHELAEVCPDAVVGEKDGVDAEGNPQYQGIDTSFLVATLTAAIQEQQAIISAQQTALTALTARVDALEGAQA